MEEQQSAKKFKAAGEVSVAFLGGKFSYSHGAAVSIFGSETAELKSAPTVSSLFKLVADNEVDFAVVPSESVNSGM